MKVERLCCYISHIAPLQIQWVQLCLGMEINPFLLGGHPLLHPSIHHLDFESWYSLWQGRYLRKNVEMQVTPRMSKRQEL